MRRAEIASNIHEIRVSRGAPSISHLLFVDDSFFFFRANLDECHTMRQILECYEQDSGQEVNLSKSCIFFSSNVRTDV